MSAERKHKIWIKKELFESNRPSVKDLQVVTVPRFQEGDDWKCFLDRLENFFQDNGVKSDRQVATLLTSISEPIYNTLKKLCRPELPTGKSYKQLTGLISKLLDEKSVWKERIKFFKLKQVGEDVNEWFVKVQNAAITCQFGSLCEEYIRTKFVCGMKSGPVLDRLCEEEQDRPCSDLLHIALVKESEPSRVRTPLVLNNQLAPLKLSPLVRRSPRRFFDNRDCNKENNVNQQSKFLSGPNLPRCNAYWGNQDDRDSKRGTKRPHGGDDDDDAPAPTCLCGLSAKKLTVRREGPNQGRDFFVCPKNEEKCSLYTWADEVAIQIQCFCQLTAKKMTVRKDGPNQGRQFFACPKNHGEPSRCQFFVWADEAESDNYNGPTGGSNRGRGGNAGSSRAGNNSSSNGARGGGSKSGPSSAKKAKATPKTSNFRGTGDKGPAKVRKCGICGQPGHNRKNCPQNDS